jgi:hypothetical protein
VLFSLTVEAGTIGPINPRLPKTRYRAPKPATRTGVFKASNDASGFHHAAQFSHSGHLQFIGKGAEQKRGHGCIEGTIGEAQPRYVHFQEFDRCGCNGQPTFCSREHGRTYVDTDDLTPKGVEREIPTGAYASFQYAARESLKKQRPDLPVASVLKREIE